jgi:formylglycine-generating enzyme required for sulfatase activity
MRVLSLFLTIGLLSGCGQSESTDSAAAQCTNLSQSAMIWVAGGDFILGENPRYREEGPPETVTVEGFWIDSHEVTNAEFAAFVEATGYKTLAEREPPMIAGAPPEMQQPGSAVFNTPNIDDRRWWRWEVGAHWRNPSGPEESIAGKDQVPVVQVAYDDALAYAEWAGKQLPSEEQWEYAARGGQDILPEPVDAKGAPQANYDQGAFPAKDLGKDGFETRAPVGCFKPNGYGLYDMIGNVWEWTNKEGSRPGATEGVKVIKGGSYLCAENYCARYRPAARQFQERGLGTDHIGFRLVDNKKPAPQSGVSQAD